MLFFKLMVRPVVAGGLAILGTHTAFAGEICGGETMPTTPPVLCAQDFGLYPGVGTDSAPMMQKALDSASERKRGLFFPAGIYRFGEPLKIRSHNSIIGSTKDATIFAGPVPNGLATGMGDESYSAAVTDVTIENIIFNNIYVRFYGPYKRRMAIRYNVFINTNRAGEQLAVSHIPYEVRGNVLMRGPNYPGLGLSTYANKVINGRGLLVEGNFLGSPDQRQRASTYVDNKTGALIDRVLQLRKDGRLSFSDDQGNYVAGWYATSQLQGAVFRRNYFAGNTLRKLWNPKTGEEDIQRDHNIYLKEYNGVDIVQNYFSGWPDQPAGQLKFRNAQNLVFAANYLDGISFNARPYDNSLLMFMRDTYIFNNVLKQIEVNHKPSESLVSYWQNFTDSPSAKIDVRDYLVFSNRFAAADKATCRVTAPKVTLSPGQFLAADNRYADGSAVASCGSVRESTVEQMKARLPQAKHKYLALQPIEPGMANDWPASDPAVKQ